MPVVGPSEVAGWCGTCRRPRVQVVRRTGPQVVLCLSCDDGPLAAKARRELTREQRRALHL